MSDKLTLGDVCQFQEGYVNPSQRNPEFFDGDIKWVRANDLNNGYVFETSRKLSKKGFQSAGKSALLFEPNTIVISKSGTIGRLGIIKDFMCGNRATINIKVDERKTNLKFIFYFLLKNQKNIQNMAVGSVQKNLYTSILSSIEISLPPLPTQKRIAAILSALDDKIENNRRTAQTLEKIAQTIFKHWFIDFEFPNQQGQPYKSSGGKMVWNEELGKKIPEGWECGQIEQCCKKIQNGGTPRRNVYEYWNRNDVPWLTSGEVRENIVIFTNNFISDEGLKNSSAKWLPELSTVVALYGATAGQVALIANKLTTNQAICGLIPNSNFAFFNYLFLSLSTKIMFNKAVGSAQQNISKKIVEEMELPIPTIEIIQKFHQIVQPIFIQIIFLKKENYTLEKLRDNLLPKLMSGEIEI